MKKHLVFNKKDCPANMGIMQLIENGDILAFASERSSLLPNPKVEDNKLTFDITEYGSVRRGYALIQDVPYDFENC